MDDDSTILIDDADEAIVGYFYRCSRPIVAVYDYDKLVAVFVKSGMTDDEAREHIEVNVIGGWLGEGTPAVLVYGNADDIQQAVEG